MRILILLEISNISFCSFADKIINSYTSAIKTVLQLIKGIKMNRVAIFFLLIFIIISCGKKDNEDQKAEYDKKVQEEMNSGVRNDTIFLGYTFVMTMKQFEKKTKELYKQGVLYLNEDNQYAHKMFLEKVLLENVEATFGPTYFENKLYKLTIAVKEKGEYTNTPSTPALIQITLKKLFSEKYGYGDWIYQKGLLEDEENYILIQGNREIEIIEAIGEARIFYTDLIAEKEYEKIEKEKSNKAIKDTKSNL